MWRLVKARKMTRALRRRKKAGKDPCTPSISILYCSTALDIHPTDGLPPISGNTCLLSDRHLRSYLEILLGGDEQQMARVNKKDGHDTHDSW
jgi:hypothetical protein